MVAVRQFRETLVADEPIRGVSISYDGLARVAASTHEEEVAAAYRKGSGDANAQYNQQILDFRSEVNALREQAFDSLEERFKVIVKEAREVLVSLTQLSVRKVLGGFEMNPEAVRAIVEATIEESGLSEDKMEIRLHSADIALLEEFEPALRARHPSLVFLPDDSLQRGDCLLSSRFGKVDGLLSTKLDRLVGGLESEE